MPMAFCLLSKLCVVHIHDISVMCHRALQFLHFVCRVEADILDLKLDIRSRILFYSDAHDGAVVMISLIDRSSKTVFRGGNKVEGLTLDTDYG